MKTLIYITAFLLVLLWAIGYFAFEFGAAIHILLVIAVVMVIMRGFREKNTT